MGQESIANSGVNGWTDEGIDRIIADPNITASAKIVIISLVRNWAWHKPSCFPSDATIAGKIGMSPGHVQRCLRELEIAGYIRREQTPRCRVIWLLWRCERPVAGAISSPIPPVVETTVGDDARGPQDTRSPILLGAESPARPVGAGAGDYSHGPPRRGVPPRAGAHRTCWF